MNKNKLSQKIILIIIGAIFSLIGSIVGGVMVIKATQDQSPHLVASLVDIDRNSSSIIIDVVNVNDYPAIGLYGNYGKKNKIPIFDRRIKFKKRTAIKGLPIRGTLDLSYLESNLTAEDIVALGNDHTSYYIKFEIDCQNCNKNDIEYANNDFMVSIDFCDSQSEDCKPKISLVSF